MRILSSFIQFFFWKLRTIMFENHNPLMQFFRARFFIDNSFSLLKTARMRIKMLLGQIYEFFCFCLTKKNGIKQSVVYFFMQLVIRYRRLKHDLQFVFDTVEIGSNYFYFHVSQCCVLCMLHIWGQLAGNLYIYTYHYTTL